MEPINNCLNSDFCIPAWANRTVNRADQAYFDCVLRQENVVIFKTGAGLLDFETKYLGQKDEKTGEFIHNNEVLKRILDNKLPHVVLPVSIQCLTPVSDLQKKIEKDVSDQKKALEKQIRSSISNALKTKAKAVQKKRKVDDVEGEAGAAVPKQTKFIFETLGLAIPKEKDEQVKVLQALIEKESTYEDLVQKSINSISLPTKIPLTRLQTEDDKSKQNRQKLLQQALAQAQAQSSESSSASGHCNHFGFQAAVSNAEKSGETCQVKD
eukprot:s125_g18.t1